MTRALDLSLAANPNPSRNPTPTYPNPSQVLSKLHDLTVQRCGVGADEEPASAGAHAACLDAAA